METSHDGKGMMNGDVAQTAGMARTRGDQFICGVWMIFLFSSYFSSLDTEMLLLNNKTVALPVRLQLSISKYWQSTFWF